MTFYKGALTIPNVDCTTTKCFYKADILNVGIICVIIVADN